MRDKYYIPPDDDGVNENGSEGPRHAALAKAVREELYGDAEQFRFDLENFLRGDASTRREFMYHTLMAQFHWSWDTLMNTPYEIVLRSNVILSVESDMKEHQRLIAENRDNT